MLLLASILSCILGASVSDTSSSGPTTRLGELRFHPRFESRRDSFVSLAPVQSVSFRGVRWTAHDFYVSIRKAGKNIDIRWLEPLPAEGKTVVDTAYGPVSWRYGRLVSDLSLSASSKSSLLVQLDTAPSLESSLGWLEARTLVLSMDTNTTSALWMDSLWLVGDRLEAKAVRHCSAQDTYRKYLWATLSLDHHLLQTVLEPDGHWSITRELGISWQGMARVDNSLPRFAPVGGGSRAPEGAFHGLVRRHGNASLVGFRIDGKWIPTRGIRQRFRADSLPTSVQTIATSERFAREVPGPDWSSTAILAIPVGWRGSMTSADPPS